MAKYIVQHRRGTASQWAAKDTIIPMAGELVIEIDEENSLHKLKIGDGLHTYAELAYLQAGDEIITQVLADAKPRIVTVDLVANWNQDADGKYSQTLALDNITKQSRLDLQPDANMLAEFKQLGLVFVTENYENTITVYSVGNMPTKAYSMQATIVETECDTDRIVGIPVGAPVPQSDWAQTDKTKADFIKNKPIENGEGINSIQQINNIALGESSVALGKNTMAGCKGYYWKAIKVGEKDQDSVVFLSETNITPVIFTETADGEIYLDTNFETPNYSSGDRIFLRNGTTHITTATIKSITNNKVIFNYVSNFPIGEIKSGAHIFAVPAKPEIGIVDMTMGMSALGEDTVAAGENSFAAGYGNIAAGNYSTVFGQKSFAGYAGVAGGFNAQALGDNSIAFGKGAIASGRNSYALSSSTMASGESSHSEAYLDSNFLNENYGATGKYSHAEGKNVVASGEVSHAEGSTTVASGARAHAEGNATVAKGENSHAEGWQTRATGKASHAEGYLDADHHASCGATGLYSHSEGFNTLSSGSYSHSEGRLSQATAAASHAEGQNSQATAAASHAEGQNTQATASASHAEGFQTLASGANSHSEGFKTIASGENQHVQGKFNIEDATSAFIIGNGKSHTSRSNAMSVDWDGNVKVAGTITDMDGNSLVGGDNTIEWFTLDLPMLSKENTFWQMTTMVGNDGEIVGVGYYFTTTVKVKGEIDYFTPLVSFYDLPNINVSISSIDYDKKTNTSSIDINSETTENSAVEYKDTKVKLGFFKL